MKPPAKLCEVCFRPARFLVLVGAQRGWPLERIVCGYHARSRESRPLTHVSLGEKLALDARYRAEYGVKSSRHSENR